MKPQPWKTRSTTSIAPSSQRANGRPDRNQYHADAERHNAGSHDPAPACSRPYMEACPDPRHPGSDQESAHYERQRERGQRRIVEDDGSGSGIDDSGEQPAQEATQAVHRKGMYDLGDPGDCHRGANDEHGGEARRHQIGRRNAAKDQFTAPQRNEPAPLSGDCVNGPSERRFRVRHIRHGVILVRMTRPAGHRCGQAYRYLRPVIFRGCSDIVSSARCWPGAPACSINSKTINHQHAEARVSLASAPPQRSAGAFRPHDIPSAYDFGPPRPVSYRNQIRRSVSSIQFSSRLAVATSPYSSQSSWTRRISRVNCWLSLRSSASMSCGST
ncbi:hypothetical protein ACVWWP_005020 [Bradyrhizobium sp. LM3.6]